MATTVTGDERTDIEPETPIRLGSDVETGEEIELPVAEVLTGRAFATGKSGSGKSNSANVIAEELLERGFPLLIIDTDGEYWSLKEEYEILHAGADQECDIQVSPEHGEKLASLALEQNVPIILDLSAFFDDDEADELIYETARHLFNKERQLKKPFLIIAEEAHEYIPERGGGDVANMMVRVGKRGRKRGLGLFAISQRPQDVKKSYISQCDWVLWHRLTWDTETDVVRRVIDKETANEVPDLDDGEGFLQADFLDDPLIRVQIKRMKTFDGGATPGLEGFDQPELKSVSDTLVDELEEISEREEQRQDKIERLESQLEEREEQIDDLEDRVERLLDLREMVENTEGLGNASVDSNSGDFTVEIDGEALESPDTIQAEVMEIKREKENLADERDELARTVEEQREKIESLQDRLEELEWLDSHLGEMREAVERLAEITNVDTDGEEELRSRLQEKAQQVQDLKEQRDELESRIEDLENNESQPEADRSPLVETDDQELSEALSYEVIKDEFQVACEEGDYATEKYQDILSLVSTADDGVTAKMAGEILSVSDTTARDVLRDLRTQGFVQSEGARPETFHLDETRLKRRAEVANRRVGKQS
ncbi:ATP-binding protein [Halorhabdus rudnickae]|uniref:ATP-binding protein n=1 Tax=Halorhabdus rudnickae TaxID=1775544 RepID=UPI001AF01E64|nr:DUF87 domain-containing protein [Halorhabdus rudnickae]